MKLKGYIFYKNGEKVAIPEDRPNSYYNALWGNAAIYEGIACQ